MKMDCRKKKILFWDHSFHYKTLSTQFFIDILNEKYEVLTLWDDSWRGGKSPDVNYINQVNPFCIIFCQLICSPEMVKQIKCKSKIWIPMYDSMSLDKYYNYLDCGLKIFSFCKRLHRRAKRYGYVSMYLQYFPSPSPLTKERDGKLRIFFWERVNNINWPLVKKLFGSNKIEKIYLKVDPDPNQVKQIPPEEDIKRYNIQLIHGWLKRKEYLNFLDQCNVFIAPRPLEGIGISNLEAMNHGLCVVAPNLPVINEYIECNKNGLLYNLDDFDELDLSRVDTLGENAKKSACIGFENWQKEKNKIFSFIDHVGKARHLAIIKVKILYLIIKVMQRMRGLLKKAAVSRSHGRN